MKPNYESGRYELTETSITISIEFRPCILGELYVKVQNIYECSPCPEGKYSLVVPNKSDDTQICHYCPYEQGASFCKESIILLKPGYWRENSLSNLIIPCINNPSNCADDGENSYCVQGHIGPLCEMCDVYSQTWNNVSYGYKSNFICTEC